MKWFNRERTKNLLTFPVETVSLLNDGEDFVDMEWADFVAEMYAEGHSFFTYTSDSVDSLASCCRLRNGIQDNTFSYTLGAGGVSTGSKCVMTININRLVQNTLKDGVVDLERVSKAVAEQVELIHKYLLAINSIVLDMRDNHMISIYDAGFVTPEKQYLTVGINGLVEGAEFLGIEPTDNEEYAAYVNAIMSPIYELNKRDKTKEVMFNTEMVPAENLGVKFSAWDTKDGYFVPRECYNSYFYRVEDASVNIIDKFRLHGSKYTGRLDGGSALHMNLEEHLTKDQYAGLLKTAIRTGCNYFTFNVPNSICNDCGHIEKHRFEKCPVCGSEDVDYATRVIGYLVRVSRWSAERQKEAARRFYADRRNLA
jgi:ribonucleoside-triphosphate reductase